MYQDELAAIERRRKIAESLMQQGQQDIPQQIAGNYVVPITPLQGISKVIQQLTGAYLNKKAGDDEKAANLAYAEQVGKLDPNSPDFAKQLMGISPDLGVKYQLQNKLKGSDPFFQFLPGEKGYLVGNARTGEVAPAMINGEPAIKASDSPILQAEIEAAKEGQKGVKVTDEQGREYYAPQHAANPHDFTNLIGSLINVESSGNPNAVSNKGAIGLTQIMPETAKNPGFGVEPMRDNSPDEQIRFGSDYLRAMIKHHGGDVKKGLAAYNGGIGNVGIPETNAYADKVLSNIVKSQSPAEAAAAKAKAELPIKIAEDQAKAEISKAKEIETATGKKAAEAQVQAKIDLPQAKANAEYTKSLIDEISNHPGLSGSIGVPSPLKYIPGTKEQGFQAKLEQLKGKQFLEAFQSLKGGGQITEVEGKKATDAIAALRESQSEDDFKKELGKLKDVIDSANQRLSQKAGEPIQETKQSGWTVRKVK